MLARLHPGRIGTTVVDVYKRIRTLLPHACQHGVMLACKAMTGLMKMGVPYIHLHWRALCFWELQYGYVPYKEEEEMVPEIQEWLCEENALGGLLGEDRYLDLMYEEARKFMAREWRVPREIKTIKEWVATGHWMEGRSGDGATTVIGIDGKPKRSRRMKTVDGVFTPDAMVELELVTAAREQMYVIQKAESGKIRPVVKTGNAVNRKMNYLSHVLEVGLYGSMASTLFAGVTGNEDIDVDLINAVRDSSTWKVPLDQGSFDKRQTKSSIAVVLLAVWDHILEKVGGGGDIERVWGALWDSLFLKGATVHMAGKKGEWINGLPSGWRWTAVLDTILNLSSFNVIRRVAEARMGRTMQVQHLYAQGDDVILATADVQSAQYLMDTYEKVGYEVHPLKTYISRNRAEFLRRSYEIGGVTGYVARSMVGLGFQNPILAAPLDIHERIYNSMAQWALVALRGASPFHAAEMFLESYKTSRIDMHNVADFTLTPSSVGGCGVDPASRFGAAIHSLGGRGRWLYVEVTKALRPLRVRLRCWDQRIRAAEWI